MTSTLITRTYRGVPSAGQFAARNRLESSIVLRENDSAASTSPYTATSELERLATHPDGRIRANVASNVNLPSVTLRELSLDSDHGVRRAVLNNQRLNGIDVENLTHDPNSTIRFAALTHENLPPHVQQRVLNHGIEDELYCLASNRGASVSFLDRLARDVSPSIRRAVAGNPSARPSVLTALLNDSDYRVRTAVRANPSTPVIAATI